MNWSNSRPAWIVRLLGQDFPMRLISKSSPSPRLLNTVASPVAGKKAEGATGKFSLKGASLFSGNGRAIFVGIVVGAAIFAILGVTYTRHQSRKHERESGARAAAVTAPHRAESLGPSALILLNQIQVSAISLGEPRLAIVNGKQVTEGDSITVSNPDRLTTVRLQVVRIADGRIDLSDGTNVITARLVEPSRGPTRKP